MNRRICEFVNPKNGEIDWLEPDTVDMICMHSVIVNDNEQYIIEWTNIESERVVVLCVHRIDSNKKYGVKMGEVEFAGMFAEVVYSDILPDDCIIVKEMIKRAIRGYNGEEVFKGILLHE
jgi:hypothetical protein